jgi:peptidoglycan hydrolase-like protein with peptidoglycan-binding domain
MGGGTAQASTTAPTVGDGYANNSNAVWCIQESLNYFSRNAAGQNPQVPIVAEDGKWGPATKAAVIAFQKNISGGTVDGYVGPRTGYNLMYYGDPYYAGNEFHPGYCWQFVPTIR